MTIQADMIALLTKTGIPAKKIDCYGRQIVITSGCLTTASKWAAVLGKFCSKVKVLEAIDLAKTNKGTCLLPTHVTVFRTYATI